MDGELELAKEKHKQDVMGQTEQIQFLETELNRLERRISDVAEDQHYVKENLSQKMKDYVREENYNVKASP